MQKISINEYDQAQLKGRYTFTLAQIDTEEKNRLQQEIQRRIAAGAAGIRDLLDQLHSICETRTLVYDNIITTVGKTLIANNLGNVSPANDPYINVVAVGDDNTTPVVANVALNNETSRKAIASSTNSGAIAYLTGFFTATEAVDQHYEAGLFADADAGIADDGVLVSHVAINVNKSNTETLTIDWELTIA